MSSTVSAAQDVHFLLLPEFSVMGFVSAIEPLRVANRFRPGSYRWHILSLDADPVIASNGMSINADGALAEFRGIQQLFVVAGFNPLAAYSPTLARWLRSVRGAGARLGAIDTGAFVLAEAGVLGRDPITLHWEAIAAFTERYPRQLVSEELFESGTDCTTCAGGTSAIDMMLHLIGLAHGRELAGKVSEQFVLGRIRSQSDHQRMEIASRYGLHNRKTIQVVKLMREHVEEPLGVDQLAASIAVTVRQLERLFSTHLRDTPSRFYLNLRLDRARELLQQTGMSVTAIGVACGFGSPTHFSRAYRTRFAQSPTGDRQA
jgi:AraC family carnitine catabolism transcriptional activator